MERMPIKVVDAWFETHKVLTKDQYSNLGSIYDIVLETVKNDGPEHQESHEKPRVTVENNINKAPAKKPWNDKEDKILKKYYPKMSLAKICKKNLLPGRTKSSLSNRCIQLGLKKYKKYKRKESESTNPENEKPNITFVNPDGTPVKGFTQHKEKRIRELNERERLFNKKNIGSLASNA